MATTNLSLFILLFSPMFLQLHATESQFFSKFTPTKDEPLPTTTIDQPQQQDQNFIPQTTDSTGYGLYGHLNPPSTTSLSTTNGGDHHDNHPTTLPQNYNTKDSFDTTIDPQYYESKNQFKGDKFYGRLPATINGGGDDANLPTTLPENYNTVAYTTPIHRENSYETTSMEYGKNYDRYNGGSRMYNYQKQGASDTRVLDYGKYNTKKQGMSDTRYMENGKYYYDLNGRSSNPRVFDSRNGYNTRVHNGNDDNSYDRYNSNARFQENQEDGFTP